MHQHLNEDGRDSLRPKGSRIDNDLGAQAGQAAAHGRSDVWTPTRSSGCSGAPGTVRWPR